MSFLQWDLGADPKARMLAGIGGILNSQARGGLIDMWTWCWRQKSLSFDPALIGAFFDAPAQADAIIKGLMTAGFIERVQMPNGDLVIKDDKDRLGFRKLAARQAGAAKSRSRVKRSRKSGDQSDHQTGDQLDDQWQDQGPISQITSQVISRQEPESHRAIRDHDLVGVAETGPLASGPNFFNPGGGKSEPLQASPAVQAESETTGDHVARGREDLGGLKQVGELAKDDFLRRFVAAFRANTPPEPQEQPKAEPMPPPKGQTGQEALEPPISPLRPPGEASAISPYEPAAPAVPPPLEKIGEGLGKGYPVEALQAHIGKVFEDTFGRPYFWHRFELQILGELLGIFSPVDILDRWRADVHELREVKALKRALMRTNGHAQRFNPNQGIMVAS